MKALVSQEHGSTVVETRGIAIPEYWRNLSVTIPDFQTSTLASGLFLEASVHEIRFVPRTNCPVLLM